MRQLTIVAAGCRFLRFEARNRRSPFLRPSGEVSQASPLRQARGPRGAVSAVFGCLLALPTAPRAQGVPFPIADMQPDRTSLPSPHFPSPSTTHTVNGVPYADHSFEGPTNANGLVLSTNEAQVPGVNGAPLYPPGTSPWTWNGAGIAGKLAPIAFNNTTTTSSPHGDFVLSSSRSPSR